MKADIGFIGLAVMGENLALNMERNGFTVAVYNKTTAVLDAFLAGRGRGLKFVRAETPKELVEAVAKPRKIMMMIKAGPPVDSVIEQLLPFLEAGDTIIDGGNSNWSDTARRVEYLASRGMRFVGTGVSGGEEGALNGPSIMPGGDGAAWDGLKPVFRAIAAKADDGSPCCEWIGPGGSGHFVKMVHNGIEYGDMQIISEIYWIMKEALGLSYDGMADVFDSWNKGKLGSYLVEITAEILRFRDADGSPLLERILDAAGQKGTGKWTGMAALDEGVPLTLIVESVFARALSARKDDRVRASGILGGAGGTGNAADSAGGSTPSCGAADSAVIGAGDAANGAGDVANGAGDTASSKLSGPDLEWALADLESALYAAKIVSYAQGFELIRAASEANDWKLDLASIARIWRGGCIIRSVFLDRIASAFEADPSIPNLALSTDFARALAADQAGWRRVVADAVTRALPVPALSSALAWFDGYRSERLPANLLQAQRDYFGAHTYERTDRPRGEFFHTDWTGHGGATTSRTYSV